MLTLTKFENPNGLEILIDEQTGESFCSVRGYARMSGKAVSTISERLAAFGFDDVNTAQIHTESGSKSVRLITESQMTEWIIDDNPAISKLFVRMGIRMYLYAQAGYDLPKQPTESLDMQQMTLQLRQMRKQLLSMEKRLPSPQPPLKLSSSIAPLEDRILAKLQKPMGFRDLKRSFTSSRGKTTYQDVERVVFDLCERSVLNLYRIGKKLMVEIA